ncbi:F-box domain-containing protein, partial [Meloidogyne graminicola]
QNKWILALKEFDDIHTIHNEDYTYVIDPIPDVVYEPIDNEVLVKWQYSINKKIPLFSFVNPWEYPEGCIVSLTSLNKKHLDLTLPNYRKNIEEMKIVRFWLEQLFRCSFKRCSFTSAIFNPEMIKLLFQNNKNIPLKFNIQEYYDIFFHDLSDKNNCRLESMCDHLFISKGILLNFYFIKNIEEQNNILLKVLLNLGNFLNLYNLIIKFIKMSEDCSKMVPNITFGECGLHSLRSLNLNMKIKPDKIEMNGENKIALCEYKNNFNPKI